MADKKKRVAFLYRKINSKETGLREFWASKDDISDYREQLIKKTDQDSGTSICRMISTNDHTVNNICLCGIGESYSLQDLKDLILVYNHLIFDFDTHQLEVE